MSIVFGGQIGLRENAFTQFAKKITDEFKRISGDLSQSFSNSYNGNTLTAPPATENIYVDTGFSNVPGTAFVGSQVSGVDDIKSRRIVTQEPQATVYIKKRAFWSLRAENDSKFMDSGDKLFARASKILFENKCTQLAAYEGLTKASRLISEDAHLDSARIDAIVDYLDSGSSGVLSAASNVITDASINNPEMTWVAKVLEDRVRADVDKIKTAVDAMRKISKDQKKLNAATYTNWVVDPDNITDIAGTGRGSGVIELTCVSEISTELGLEDNKGSISFTIEDPLNLTKINNDDLEMALGAAYEEAKDIERGNDVRLGPSKYLEDAKARDEELRRRRRARLNGGTFNGLLGSETSGNFLSGSNEADIVFEVNGSSMGGDDVVGYVSGVTEPFNSSNFNLAFGMLPAEQMLTSEESSLVREIFSLLDRYASEVTRLRGEIDKKNKDPDVTYARRNLRNFYLGKSLIQPMDGVHVYLRGNTLGDGEVVGPLSALLNNSNFIKTFRDDQAATHEMLEEEMRQFGIKELDIPVDLYKTLRTGSFMRNAGMHVFGGLVSMVVEAYNPERGYTLSVSGQSTLKWLDLSRVNVSPSFNQTQGVLEDPLTPYEIQVDPGTGLIVSEPHPLQENAERMDGTKSGSNLIYKSGAHKGLRASQDNMVQDYSESSSVKIVQHAPGMVYKWKNGIMTATRNVNMYTALDGSGISRLKLAREVGITTVEEPFSSMDAADVISILVTGFPHNYESFLSHTREYGLYTFGGGTNSSKGYFNSTFDILQTTNRALGNFQPFKTINVPTDQMFKRLQLQTDLLNESKDLNRLRAEYAALQDEIRLLQTPAEQLTAAQKNETNNERIMIVTERTKRRDNLEEEIMTRQADIVNSAANGRANGLRIYGSDMALEIESAEGSDEENTSINRIRLKNELLQFRAQLRCKYNEDANYFIVCDEYDKDLDIQAFILNLINLNDRSMWNSEFLNPYETCCKVAKTLDMEFFSDSQGHIQFRVPKYNKVPLSLILKMMLLQEKERIKLYPIALESLFNTKYESLKEEEEVISLRIQIETILLGNVAPETKSGESVQIDDKKYFSMAKYLGIASEETRKAISNSLAKLLIEKRKRLNALTGDIDAQALSDAAKEIDEYNNPANPNVNTKRLNKVNQISQLVSRKQRITDIIHKMDRQKSKYGDFDVTKLRGTPLSPESAKKILNQFSDLVEDDFNDSLGPGSASRYIITDDRIINSTFTESDQTVFCRVDVTGEQPLLRQGPGMFAGMPMIWAGATDFDLWRQYGYRSYGPVHKPFFKDGASQCAPYAQMLLTRAKKDAVRGILTVVGNEYYQLGDVVYVNCRDLLYYVVNVKHNFSYASGFTTTLDLRLGHPLGEYIPTPMDIIGKTMIKNQVAFNNVKSYRQLANRNNGVIVGAIKFDAESSGTSEVQFKNMLSGAYAKYNIIQLKNALSIIRKKLGMLGDYPKVQLRGFSGGEDDDNLAILRMDAVLTWLTSPSIVENGTTYPLSNYDFPPLNKKNFESYNDYNYPIRISVGGDVKAVPDQVIGMLPSEETFQLMGGGNPNRVVEIALVFKPIKKKE